MTDKALPLLGGLTRQQFLDEYWQKKPLLVRQALPVAATLSDPEELAGLSLEDEIESRIIIGADKHWQVQHGPFDEDTYKTLAKNDWTLLVQAINFYLPQFTPLISQFDFLPKWRIDDVMASYAAPGGSVGPHFDNYDVFLIQGFGKRHWKVGQLCDENSVLQSHPDLRLLEEFNTEEEWILEPGDMLYIPPRIAHFGVAVDACITYSLGFTSPSTSQVAEYFCDDVLERDLSSKRYADPMLSALENNGVLTKSALQQFKSMLIEELDKPEVLSHWLARMISEPKYNNYSPAENDKLDDDAFFSLLKKGEPLLRDEASRFIFTEHEETKILYINGSEIPHPGCPALLTVLCGHQALEAECLVPLLNTPKSISWLNALYCSGYLYFDGNYSAHA
ncbi:MAG: cupin domain-containing protein [Pseudomonadales bacterium]|nr:cupin domain-containing protein [Pseudomonadales bacterium]